MMIYTALTFAPVQGFIERSRKLRDLFGASMILSFLSQKIIENIPTADLISPGAIDREQGTPNRILLSGEYSHDQLRETIDTTWREVLRECRTWIERKLPDYPYTWERDWKLWGAHTWEVFHGSGTSITEAMKSLEDSKLGRDWVGVNWIGESSSLSGTDAIAWYGMGAGSRNPKFLSSGDEKPHIDEFYQQLSGALEKAKTNEEPQGRFLDDSERLSIPELVKRLVTHYEVADALGMTRVHKFSDIKRQSDPKADPPQPGEWSAWFMGDGDKVGDRLKNLLEEDPTGDSIQAFSKAMGEWGKRFDRDFKTKYRDLGRVIYAGGDDFLGVLYNTSNSPLTPETTAALRRRALDWLGTLNDTWKTHGQDKLTLSVGFVWAGHGVPQRDVLQHCREAEKNAKEGGRDRVTLRVVFNNGQHVQWVTPWDWLPLLGQYRDRNGGDNWAHVYNDWAQLKARHAVEPHQAGRLDRRKPTIKNEQRIATAILERYFDRPENPEAKRCSDDALWGSRGRETRTKLFGDDSKQHQIIFINWVNDLIEVGWHLCRPYKSGATIATTDATSPSPPNAA